MYDDAFLDQIAEAERVAQTSQARAAAGDNVIEIDTDDEKERTPARRPVTRNGTVIELEDSE
jgi:hypothetical protein